MTMTIAEMEMILSNQYWAWSNTAALAYGDTNQMPMMLNIESRERGLDAHKRDQAPSPNYRQPKLAKNKIAYTKKLWRNLDHSNKELEC